MKHLLKKLKSLLLDMRFNQKILLLVMVIVFVSNTLFFIISYRIIWDSAKEKAMNYNISLIHQIGKNIDSYFQGIDSFAFSIAFNSYVQRSIIATQAQTQYDMTIGDAFVKNAMNIAAYSKQNLDIQLFSKIDGSAYTTVASSAFVPEYDLTKDSWYQALNDEDIHHVKQVIYNNRQSYLQSEFRKQVLTVAYKIFKMGNLDTIGYLLMDIDKAQFNAFVSIDYKDILDTIIMSSDRDILYQSGTGSYIKEVVSNIPLRQREGSIPLVVNNQKYTIIYGSSDYADWKIINVVSNKSLLTYMNSIKMIYLSVLLGVFLLSILITYRFSILITAPLKKIKEAMTGVREGIYGKQISSSAKDEVGELIDKFNHMTLQIGYLVKKNETTELLKKEAQLKALQHQINPHFLYNTMEILKGLSSGENAGLIRNICNNLGNMFRYNLNDKKIVRIDEELEHIKSYIYIMEIRHEGMFQTEFDIDECALSYKTIKFSLQPFVENAISHGFSQTTGGGKLLIHVSKIKDKIIFKIADNGRGVNSHALEQINQLIHSAPLNYFIENPEGQHIGITNVYMRMRALFNDKCDLRIETQDSAGTTVTIIIPLLN